ncbi:hypothetical protein F3Y22_tig00111540pilonHSYRG00156 [Hibiscus syriacus]|uniref:Uncharacterized protein n=1 Tax=Hibiscus syriacus TaxID=106335 RepID=A0A6A2Y1Q7_HIBSY|nr:hypothetical protein F3Y22_tig00111540pilonHSYRG00156 [Hibiscus syriacus]
MVDDWEFADGFEEEMPTAISAGGKPMARVLFGGLIYHLRIGPNRPNDTHSSGSSSLSEEADDVKATLAPKPAAQVFKLLDQSPAIQTIVASIAADPNVWNAVLHNPAYIDFRSHKTRLIYHLRIGPNRPNDTHSSGSSSLSEEADDVKATLAPKPAAQVFKLLDQSPAIQTIVASIAADPNVWNAVLHNPAYINFRSHKTKFAFDNNGSPRRYASSSLKIKEHLGVNQPQEVKNPFFDFVEKFKTCG